MEPFYHWQGDRLILQLQIQPRASKNEIVAPQGDYLKIRITAPPVDGKANKHLQKLLAKWFGVKQRDVTLLQGESSRHKRVAIDHPKQLPWNQTPN